MTSASATVNPLTALPLAGSIIGLINKFLLDLRFSTGWAEFVEFLALVVTLFLALIFIFGRLLPRLATALLESTDRWIVVIPTVLLAPEWLVTKLLGRLGRPPGRIVYGYGDCVLVLADGTRAMTTVLLQLIRSAGSLSRPIAAGVLILGFLLWNSGTCVGGTEPCVSPVQQWVQAAGYPRAH